MTLAERIGRNVVNQRERAGITQEVLGFRAAMHRTAIGQIERGERMPRADSLIKIAGALGCSPNDLLAGLFWNPTRIVQGDYEPFGEPS